MTKFQFEVIDLETNEKSILVINAEDQESARKEMLKLTNGNDERFRNNIYVKQK